MKMSRLSVCLCLILFLTPDLLYPQQTGHAVISEIRYDERSGINEEFVELYNPTPGVIALGNWSLAYKSKTGTKWYNKIIFTEDHFIPANGYFLWGGTGLVTQADAAEENPKNLGLSNSGGHIALLDPDGRTVDLVAWEGGDSPEGSGDAGKTEDGGSLERKARAISTAENMREGGTDEVLGNGYDTDNNQDNFVVHGPDFVNPQNTESRPEPPGNAPRIITGPDVIEWHENSVIVRWKTDLPSTAQLLCGLSSEYSDTVDIPEPDLDHQFDLTGLEAATVYSCKLIVKNEYGETCSGDNLFITRSHTESTGEMNTYFSGSIETAEPDSQSASGGPKLSELLIRRIDRALYSIDACFYSMSDWDVQDALVDAFSRGVQVRFIYDADHDLSDISRILDAGIPVIQDDFGENLSEGIMHNKFAVFDHRNDTAFSDDWIWTGSYNPNYNGTYPDPFDNCIEIQDEALAELYTIEFEEMWGSNTGTPDESVSRFGSRKTDNIPHQMMVNETRIQVYMSPSDQATRAIVSAVREAEQSLCFAIFSFTSDSVSQAMYDQWSNLNNFKLSGIFDSDQKDNDGAASQWEEMIEWNPAPDVFLDNEQGYLHHKYMLIDHHTENPLLITGSQNWSVSGGDKNDENVLIIQNRDMCGRYLQEFASRYHAAGGGEDLTASLIQHKRMKKLPQIHLYPNFPNPFNGRTLFRYRIESEQKVRIQICNLNGRLLKKLTDQIQPAGTYSISWDGTNSAGQFVSSGVYLFSLLGTDYLQSQKLILLR